MRCTLEISVEDLKPIKVKGALDTRLCVALGQGKAQAVKIFKPHMAQCNPHVGCTERGADSASRPGVGADGLIAFPWYDRSLNVGDGSGDKSQLAEILQAVQDYRSPL